MAHPPTTLSALIACASVAGAICWPMYQQNRLKYENPAANSTTPAQAGAPDPADALTSFAPEGASNTTESRIVMQLRDDLEALKAENTDLRKQLSNALMAKQPPPTVEQVLEKASDLVGREFKTKPIVQAVPLDEIGKRVADRVKSEVSPQEGVLRARAYQALGLVPEANYNLGELLGDIAAEQWPAFYDAEQNTLFYQSDADLRRMDGRYRLASGAFAALVSQYFPAYKDLRYASPQDDASRALRGFIVGEVNTMRSTWDTQDDFMNLVEDTEGPASFAPSTGPHYVMEEHKRTVEAGKNFVEYLIQSVTAHENLMQAYLRPPTSTTELLHPELYKSNPPFQPKPMDVPDPTVDGASPIFSNVMGELSMQILVGRHATPELASVTSEGWLGDRYYIYEAAEAANADVAWLTAWQTPRDAKEFFEAMCRILPRRFGIPLQKEYFQENSFVVKDANRVIIVRLRPNDSVSVITASSRPKGEALDGKFNAGS